MTPAELRFRRRRLSRRGVVTALVGAAMLPRVSRASPSKGQAFFEVSRTEVIITGMIFIGLAGLCTDKLLTVGVRRALGNSPLLPS